LKEENMISKLKLIFEKFGLLLAKLSMIEEAITFFLAIPSFNDA